MHPLRRCCCRRRRRSTTLSYRRAMMMMILLCHDNVCFPWTVAAWYIAPPRTTTDWIQMSSLLVDHSSSSSSTNNGNNNKSSRMIPTSSQKREQQPSAWTTSAKFLQNLGKRALARRQVYQHYVRTAQRLQGSKYAVLLAKQQDGDIDGNDTGVIGMVELGMVDVVGVDESEHGYKFDNDNSNGANSKTPTSSSARPTLQQRQRRSQRQPTIGVLCVDPRMRRSGVATELIRRCEAIVASPAWRTTHATTNVNEDDADTEYVMLYAQVEANNPAALAVFGAAGFVASSKHKDNSDGKNKDDSTNETAADTVWVSVRTGTTVERRPHTVLCKCVPVL